MTIAIVCTYQRMYGDRFNTICTLISAYHRNDCTRQLPLEMHTEMQDTLRFDPETKLYTYYDRLFGYEYDTLTSYGEWNTAENFKRRYDSLESKTAIFQLILEMRREIDAILDNSVRS